MMHIDPHDIADIVRLNGGKIVGKTRLQKTFYFLETFDSGFGFDFQYYHYGPYSEDLSLATDDAIALDALSIEWKSGPNSQYAVFHSKNAGFPAALFAEKERTIKILSVLGKYDSISLELAATADFLSRVGYNENSWSETKVRKSAKATDERIAKAKMLLSELRTIDAN